MRIISWGSALTLAASMLAVPATAKPAAPTTLSTKPDKPWTHKPSDIGFPAAIDGFARTAVQDLSGGPLLDVSVAYDDPVGRTHVNIYLYHAAMPATALWFDVAKTMIATNDQFGQPAAQGDPVAFAIPGGAVAAGLRQSFSITKIGRSSGVALIAIGEWVVKLRMTSPVHDAPELDMAMERMIQQIGWPRKRPPLSAVTPLSPCARPRTFGSRAAMAEQDDGALLLNAMIGGMATDSSRRARTKGEAPDAPTLCVHPDRIGGRLPIYQGDREDGGYIIPLGDSGIVLDVGQNSLASLLNIEKGQDAPSAPWTVTVKTLDRWEQYPSYATMPPPTQAIDIIQQEKPLSSTSVYGKGGTRISISPEAMKNE